MMSGGYEPVEWERVGLGERGRWVPKGKEPEKPDGNVREAPGELLGTLDYIRRLVCGNRQGILLLISVLLICDCDDSVEMLIALALFLYPVLKR